MLKILSLIVLLSFQSTIRTEQNKTELSNQYKNALIVLKKNYETNCVPLLQNSLIVDFANKITALDTQYPFIKQANVIKNVHSLLMKTISNLYPEKITDGTFYKLYSLTDNGKATQALDALQKQYTTYTADMATYNATLNTLQGPYQNLLNDIAIFQDEHKFINKYISDINQSQRTHCSDPMSYLIAILMLQNKYPNYATDNTTNSPYAKSLSEIQKQYFGKNLKKYQNDLEKIKNDNSYYFTAYNDTYTKKLAALQVKSSTLDQNILNYFTITSKYKNDINNICIELFTKKINEQYAICNKKNQPLQAKHNTINTKLDAIYNKQHLIKTVFNKIQRGKWEPMCSSDLDFLKNLILSDKNKSINYDHLTDEEKNSILIPKLNQLKSNCQNEQNLLWNSRNELSNSLNTNLNDFGANTMNILPLLQEFIITSKL